MAIETTWIGNVQINNVYSKDTHTYRHTAIVQGEDVIILSLEQLKEISSLLLDTAEKELY